MSPADLLDLQAPALSATSDMPVLPAPKPDTALPAISQPADQAAAVAKPDAAAATPKPADGDGKPAEGDKPADGDGGEPKATDGDAGDGKPPKPKLSERMSDLTQQRKDAEARAKAADDRADKLTDSLKEAIETINKIGTTKGADAIREAETADPRPTRDKFSDPNAYDDALVEWSTRQGSRIAAAEFEKKAAETRAEEQKQAEEKTKAETDAAQKAEAEGIAKRYDERRTKAMEKYPDFVEITESDDIQIGLPMAHVILNAENGPDIAYHLGKNPAEAARIAALPQAMQIFEMGQIAARLATVKPNVSKAPDPITATGSRQAAAPKSPEEETGDEYYNRRNAEIVAARSH